jgi:hypothetical protein
MGPVHWNASKSSLSNHNSQGIAMQSYGLTARITGYYPDGAFSQEIGLNSRFDTRRGLTPGLLDVGTETPLLSCPIRRWI